MVLWGSILLILNLALMAAIAYIIFFKRPLQKAQGTPSVPIELIQRLNNELTEVKGVAKKLETRSVDLSMYENGLKERQAVLEDLIVKAKASAGGPRQDGNDDIYSKAFRMLKSGVPAGEIARSLGLLRGEAELLSSLHKM